MNKMEELHTRASALAFEILEAQNQATMQGLTLLPAFLDKALMGLEKAVIPNLAHAAKCEADNRADDARLQRLGAAMDAGILFGAPHDPI